jgi:hypothetical protein
MELSSRLLFGWFPKLIFCYLESLGISGEISVFDAGDVQI